MFDVLAIGECLIDFAYLGKSKAGSLLLEQNPGGAPVNVLAALQRLGRKTAFIGKVGDDMHGRFLEQALKEEGINTEGLVFSSDSYTTLAFVNLDDGGERSFSFARKPGADTRLRMDECRCDLIERSKVFHFGSLSMTHEPARSATLEAIKAAKKCGCILSYDPNYRAPLWDSVSEAIRSMQLLLEYADLLKLSEEEALLLTSTNSREDAATALLQYGISLVVISLGPEGALVCHQEGLAHVPAFQAEVVDTTGAGDAFWGGFLSQLVENINRPAEWSLEEAVRYARFGNAAASLAIEKRGGIPAMPTYDEVLKRLEI